MLKQSQILSISPSRDYFSPFAAMHIMLLWRVCSDYRRGFGLDIGFINRFNTKLVIILNYSDIADFHSLQFTVLHSLMLSISY
jgi:hypothetical protein